MSVYTKAGTAPLRLFFCGTCSLRSLVYLAYATIQPPDLADLNAYTPLVTSLDFE